MKINIKRSILILSILSVLFISMAMVSASDVADELAGTDLSDGPSVGSDAPLMASENQDDDSNGGDGSSETSLTTTIINHDVDEYLNYGDNLVFNTNISDEEGNLIPNKQFSVNLYDGEDLKESHYVNTIKTIEISGTTFELDKTYTLNFVFLGDSEFAPFNDTANFTVIEKHTSYLDVDLISDYFVGNSTDIHFKLYNEFGDFIRDDLDIYLDGDYYGTATSTGESSYFTLEQIALGLHEVNVVFNGTDFYDGNSASFNITRYEKDTYIDIKAEDVLVGKNQEISLQLLNADDNIIIYDEFNVSIVGTDENSPEVIFEKNYTFTGNGTISIDAADLKEGASYLVNAVYEGNLVYAPIEDYIFFKCVSRDTNIDVYAYYAPDNEDIVLELALMNMAHKNIVGEVILQVFDNESQTVVDPIAFNTSEDENSFVNIGKLPAGHYIINTKFEANHFYNGYDGNNSLHVFKGTELLIAADDIFSGDTAKVNIDLLANDGALLNETIFVSVHNSKNKEYFSDYINLTEGKASLEFENLTEDLFIYVYYDNKADMYGPYRAEYMSAYKYGSIRIIDNYIANAKISLTPNEDSITVDLVDLAGNPIANASLSVDVGDDSYNLTTDDKGQANIENLKNNSTVKVKYTDANNHSVSEKTLVLGLSKEKAASKINYKNMNTVTVASADGRIGKYFEVSLTDAAGKALVGKKVQIGFNGKVYNRTTNVTGGVSLQINLPRADLYTFALCFLGDEEYNGTFEVALINVTKQAPKLTAAAKTYKASAKTKSLTATFKTAKGNAIKNKNLVFIINGKLYTGKTNSKGVATVKVSISARGTYTCTVSSTEDDTFKATSTKFTVKIT